MKRVDALALGALAMATAVTAAVYSRLPDPIATHFDLRGTPNGWMPRAAGAWCLPVFGLVLWVLMRFAPRVLPTKGSASAASTPVATGAALTAAFIAAVHMVILYVALAPGAEITRPIFAVLGAFFVGVGLVLPRVRRNALVGVRTPWSLSNDENWARTQRVAGYAMVLGGIVAGLLGAVGGPSGGAAAIAVLIATAIVPVVYSFALARRQDDRG